MSIDSSISVIIPTFNRADFLDRALTSILGQSLQPDEIIVIDDGSTDNTQGLVKGDYPQVKYIYQENKGVSAARNLGLSKAQSKWLAFLDSDDEWLPKKLAMQVEQLNQNQDIKLCHTNEIWIRNEKRINQMKKHKKHRGWIYDKCLPLCAISPSSVIIHRSLFDSIGNFDESLPACEDYDLWLRICAYYPVSYIEEPLIIKRGGHDDQLSRKYWGMDRFRIRALEKIINDSNLSLKYRTSSLKMIIEKIRIYIIGAEKRDKTDEVDDYTERKKHYEKLLKATADNHL